MCLLEMKWFVLTLIGLGLFDFVKDALKLLPSFTRVADMDDFDYDNAQI